MHPVVEHRHRQAADEQRGHFAGNMRERQALEDRIEEDHARPDYDRHGGEKHRLERP